MKIVPTTLSHDGRRFALHTGAVFVLMLVPCALQAGCSIGVIPPAFADALLAISMSGAAVGSVHLLSRLCMAE